MCEMVINYCSLIYLVILLFSVGIWYGLLKIKVCTNRNKFRWYISKVELMTILSLIQPAIMLLSTSLKSNYKQGRFWIMILFICLIIIAVINIWFANLEGKEWLDANCGSVRSRLIKSNTKSYYIEELITHTNSGFCGIGKSVTDINRVIKGKKE